MASTIGLATPTPCPLRKGKNDLRIVFVHTPMASLSVAERQLFWRNFDLRYHAMHPGLRHMRRNLWELPHWMTWLAGVLVARGYSNLAALDFYASECALTGIDQAKVLQSLRDAPGDLYLFSPMTPNLSFAFEIADLIKELYPASKTVFGGVIATPLHKQIAGHPSVDFVVHGRGEYALPDLLDAIIGRMELNKVGNLCYRLPSGTVSKTLHTYPWMLPAELPFPKVDLFPPEVGEDIRYLRQVYGLGCPYRCQICTIQTIGHKPVYFSPDRVLDEIHAYRAHYGSHHNIYFGDETFTINSKRTYEICSALQADGTVWYDCQTRLNLVDDGSLLEAMERSGCRWVELGIESIDQDTQDIFKQRVRLDRLITTLSRVRDSGLAACSFLVNGFPNQTLDDMRRSIDVVAELIGQGLLHATYLFGLVPYPGSDLYSGPEKYGIKIHHHNFKLYHEDMEPVFSTHHASADQIYEVFLYGLRELGSAMNAQPQLGHLPQRSSVEEFGTFWTGSHV
jgi:radical SAM superfamily enzyme YgiQ (UPF0313 family)